MPPRLPIPSAMRAWAPTLQIRTIVNSPRYAQTNQQSNNNNNNSNDPSQKTSTSSLLSLHRTRRNAPPRLNFQRPNGSSAPPGRDGETPANDSAARLLARYTERSQMAQRNQQQLADRARERQVSSNYLAQAPRRWKAGEIYSPAELSAVQTRKWRRLPGRNVDAVDTLGISPVDMYKNFTLITAFTNSDGAITKPHRTALRPVNQRRIAKMIRRARGLGIYPTAYVHPEIARHQFFPDPRK